MARHPLAASFIAWLGDAPVGLVNCFEAYSTFKAMPEHYMRRGGGDYDHLARVKEWSLSGGAEEDEGADAGGDESGDQDEGQGGAAEGPDEAVVHVACPVRAGVRAQALADRDARRGLGRQLLSRMHRLDLARAVHKRVSLDPEVDGRVVADLVSDWAARHRQPVALTLTGPAGGTFSTGDAAPNLTLDALDFARIMAGRQPDTAVEPSPLWNTKVLF